jgi:ABC-type transport system involved in multi-copper enzyme maturation permease subunit
VLVSILVGSEFVFKTSRQNIIDGLTREEFFLSKVVSVLIIAVAFFTIYLLLGFVFGFVLVPSGSRVGAIVRPVDLQMMGGFFVYLTGFGLLAMLIASAVRNTGTAMGLFFFYIFVVEGIAPQLLRLRESTRPLYEAMTYLPGNVFHEIVKPARYDADNMWFKIQQMTGQPTTFTIATDVAWWCALGYIVLISGASYLIFKYTDL